jgi:hypothetical protein
LTTIVLLALVSTMYVPSGDLAGSYAPGGSSSGTIDGSQTNTTFEIASQDFDMSGSQMAIGILLAALIIGGVAGIHFLGSGLSELSQALIFQSVIYLGLWTVFSVLAWGIIGLAMGALGLLLWFVLTLVYVVGFATEIQGTGSG